MKKKTENPQALPGLRSVDLTERMIGRRMAAEPSRVAIDGLFSAIGAHLREGRSNEAEELLQRSLESYRLRPDDHANLRRLLSFTLETAGRYTESLEVIAPYAEEKNLASLSTETQVRVVTQLAIATSNSGEQPKAVTLLKEVLTKAESGGLRYLMGSIDIGLARVYRKLSEYPICRDHAENALVHFREDGNWLGMAEAYREIANSLHQEGDSEKAIENFELGIQIIGSNSAPFMLGKLYTDMSGAYWFLRKPQDGIECLEKSIAFFDQTEHALNSVIAYNNLGINLMLIGEWTRAEQMILRALDIGLKENYVHVAGIYDSLGELNILRGDLEEAEELLEKAVAFAKERERPWYTVQSMRNLARCYLAKGEIGRAIEKAGETIDLAHEIGDKHYANMAGLVLAEGLMQQGKIDEAEKTLGLIELADPSADFFVLGNIQRIRGMIALEGDEKDLAVHHFSRALTIFEAGNDPFHTALIHSLLGENLGPENAVRAKRHLSSAGEIYKKLGLTDRFGRAAKTAEKINSEIREKQAAAPREERRKNAVVSQLLTVRLAEATASRELLFRELVAVLQQESNAKRIIVAQYNDEKVLYPFITHGYSPQESAELVRKFDESVAKNETKAFARAKNVAVFPLRVGTPRQAYLLINPLSGASLIDGTALHPLISVVELGMDVIALRTRDRTQPAEAEAGSYTSSGLLPGFIHSSPAMTSLVEEVYKIRSSDVTVLVTGESGTGKELVSRAIHAVSNRKDKVFVPFNCTAVPKELAEGHLFGYRKGAFTGAVNDYPGVIRTADGGTLFLDEVGDLPIDVQPKLLRFLQEGEIQTLGEKTPIRVDVRIIAATNMPLEEKVADGSFREDLYYRLNVIRLRVPPLRERRAEIPPIVNYYVNHYSERFKKGNITFSPQAIDMLMVSKWDGNVRQLCNEIQRIIARSDPNDVIGPEHLSPDLKRAAQPIGGFDATQARPIASYDRGVSPFSDIGEGTTLEAAVSELEMALIKASLTRNNWNISRVAAELGLTRRGLYLKLARYGIEKAA